MKKPVEPQAPLEPWKEHLSDKVSEHIGPLYDDKFDGYYYPEITIGKMKKWAEDNNILPDSLKISFYESNHTVDMYLEGKILITQEMIDEVENKYQESLKFFKEVELPQYEKDLRQYEEDLKAYYKWKHNSIER